MSSANDVELLDEHTKVFKRKSRISALPIEEMKIGKYYAISFNPKTQHVSNFKDNVLNVLETHADSMRIMLSTVNADYQLNLESSPTGRIHYHGIIKFPSLHAIAHFYVISLPLIAGRASYCMTDIENRDDWDAYCGKQSIWEKIGVPDTILCIEPTDASIKRSKTYKIKDGYIDKSKLAIKEATYVKFCNIGTESP